MADEMVKGYLEDVVTVTIQEPYNYEEVDTKFIKHESEFKLWFYECNEDGATVKNTAFEDPLKYDDEKPEKKATCRILNDSSSMDFETEFTVARNAPIKEEFLDLLTEYEELLEAPNYFYDDINIHVSQLNEDRTEFDDESSLLPNVTDRIKEEIKDTPLQDLTCLQAFENSVETIIKGVNQLKDERIQLPEESIIYSSKADSNIKEDILDIHFEYVQGFESHDCPVDEIYEQEYQIKDKLLENVINICSDNVAGNRNGMLLETNVKADVATSSQHPAEASDDTLHTNTVKQYTCKYCEMKFTKLDKMQNHYKSCKKTKVVYSCVICGTDFVSKLGAKKHKDTHLCDGKHKCPACSKMFDTEADLIKHTTVEHKEGKLYKCSLCEQSFTKERKRSLHLRVHNRLKPLSCNICMMKCTSKPSLTLHLRTHSEFIPHSCTVCGGKYRTAVLLRQHKCLQKIERSLPCLICDRKFKLQWHLSNHMVTHNTHNATFTCTVCNRTFIKEKSLIMHGMLFHNNVSSYQCTICKIDFFTKRSLFLHMRGHDPTVTPYPCTTCENSFSSMSSWQRHMRENIWMTIHPCTVCGVKFTKSDTLQNHLTTTVHKWNELRYFTCSICGNTFTKGESLSVHIMLKHNNANDQFRSPKTVPNEAWSFLSNYEPTPVPVSQIDNSVQRLELFDRENTFIRRNMQCRQTPGPNDV